MSQSIAPLYIRLSRRRLATLASVGGLAGGLWTVGLVAISRGSKPDLTVVGNDAWQVALLEAGSDRVLICSGLFEESANPAVRHLLTTLRQHIDVVVATGSALRQLERRGALATSVVVQLDAPPNQTDTPSFRALRQQLTITFADGQLNLERIPQDEWSESSPADASWGIQLTLHGLTIAMAPDLQTAAHIAPPDAVLVLAPGGDAIAFLRSLPGVAVATNGYTWNDISEQHVTDTTYLIRTFPDDPARFLIDDGRLVLPVWAQELVPPGSDS